MPKRPCRITSAQGVGYRVVVLDPHRDSPQHVSRIVIFVRRYRDEKKVLVRVVGTVPYVEMRGGTRRVPPLHPLFPAL